MPKRRGSVVLCSLSLDLFVSIHPTKAGCFRQGASRDQAHLTAKHIERHSLPPFGVRRNHKTPERTTIGKPLYFCSVEFVGQFTSCDQRSSGTGAPLIERSLT